MINYSKSKVDRSYFPRGLELRSLFFSLVFPFVHIDYPLHMLKKKLYLVSGFSHNPATLGCEGGCAVAAVSFHRSCKTCSKILQHWQVMLVV